MSKVWGCIANQHDLRLLALAVIICFVSSLVAIRVWWQGMDGNDESRKGWTFLAGAASGFGVWSTHFLAMIAYSPGLPVGFDLPLVLTSLIIAILLISAGLSLTDTDRSGTFPIAAGVVIALGITATHYLGAQSISLPGRIGWEARLIGASIGIGVVACCLALWIASHKRGMPSLVLSSALLATATVGLHFTGMAAMIVIPDPRMGGNLTELSANNVGWSIILVGLPLVMTVAAALTRSALLKEK